MENTFLFVNLVHLMSFLLPIHPPILWMANAAAAAPYLAV